jgi:hypothetical protein
MKRSILPLLLLLCFAPGERTLKALIVANGDFEAVQIGSPFMSSNPADIPGWTHTGSVGDALLWGVGYVDPGGSITVAGHGNQFVTLGGGFPGVGTGNWDQTLNGLTPGGSYILTFDMATEGQGISSQSLTVGFPSGSSTSAATFTAGPSSANYWRNWEAKTMIFIATISSVDLQFTATTRFDVGLDNVVVGLPGDVNHDGVVNGLDIADVASHWLQTGTGVMGDANGDGTVNGLDIALIASNWLRASGGAASVPEPSTIVLAALGALVLLARLNRSSRLAGR